MTNETQKARERQPNELWTNYLVERLIGDFRNDRNNLYLPKVIPDDFEGSIGATEIIIDIPTRKGIISASQRYNIDFVRNAKEARKLFCPHPYETISVTEGPISTTEEPQIPDIIPQMTLGPSLFDEPEKKEKKRKKQK